MLALITLIAYSPFARSQATSCATPSAQIVSLQGKAEIQRASAGDWTQSQLQDALCPGDAIRVRARSRVALYIPGQSTPLRLSENSSLTFPTSVVQKEQPFVMELAKGRVHVLTRTPSSFTIKTPFVTAAVKGTEFLVEVEDDQARVTVYEGRVVASNELGEVDLAKDESAIAERGAAPRKVLIVKPRDAVQWAIYYPPVIDPIATADTPSALSEAANLYRGGQVDEALERLEQVPLESRNYAFHTFRASLSLLTGSKDAAVQDIDTALQVNPNGADAYALKTIVAVAQNEKEQARGFAAKAIELSPNAASGYVAQSYAQQASFEIENALDSAKQATKLDHMNALAWARVAELELSTSNLDKGLDAAKRATELNPRYGRTQTILGFANLTRIDTKAAKEAFNKAAELDQADPLPRLGLGLAIIREGELAKGRQQLEIAASLDPENSLIRSYLGKAYYEEKRDTEAGGQFELAKNKDPLDPTPWFYSSVLHRALNAPVDALRDEGTSTRLNDNRAVYRSGLLLDNDLAARNTNLATVFTTLGFDQLALLEAYKSIAAFSNNFSAHRFLSDYYSTLPRHEVARDSELLQAQLLQPITLSPVQPQLASDPLDFLQNITSPALGFNEFNGLSFSRSFNVNADLLVGSRDTTLGSLVASGITGRVGYSIGVFHSATNGSRPNNDREKDIANAFLQTALSPDTSVLFEARNIRANSGSTRLFFFDDHEFTLDEVTRESSREKIFRLGGRHSIGGRDTVIATYAYRKFDDDLKFVGDFPQFFGEQTHSGELRYLHDSTAWSATAGLGILRLRQTTDPEVIPGQPETDSHNANAYIYATLRPTHHSSLNLGLSYDAFKDIEIRRKQFNPKLGGTLKLFDRANLRIAFARGQSRPLVSSQTLEPTEIAGFNQFYNDIIGSESLLYAMGLDIQVIPSVFAGSEVSRRTVSKIHRQRVARETSLNEESIKGYVYFAKSNALVLSGRYEFRRISGDEDGFNPSLVANAKTHLIPLEVRTFARSGQFGKARTTFVHQSGDFCKEVVGSPERFCNTAKGTDNFWIVDLLIGFRIPKRSGVFALEVRNALDTQFQFQDLDPNNSLLARRRVVLGRLALEF